MEHERIIAVCGLDCTDCELRLLPTNADAARIAVDWFHEMGWLKPDEGVAEAIERRMYCQGCRGSRDVHWSADCALLQCCVDRHGLAYCSDCDEFVCERLASHGAKNKAYAEGLERLWRMRRARA